MRNVDSKLLIFALGLTLTGSACKSAVYDNAPSAIASASPAPTGTVTTTSVINGAITPEKLSQAYLPLAGGTLTGTLTLAGAPTGANDAATKAYVDSAVGSGVTKTYVDTSITALIPAGFVGTWAGSAAPTGWLLCDGTAVSRTTYASLFTAIGITHGSGDGSTTFNLPDYRGRFLRGTDNMGSGAAARDPDAAGRTAMNVGGNTANNVGSVQTGDYALHNHGVTDPGHSHSGHVGTVDGGQAVGGAPTRGPASSWDAYPINIYSNTTGISINNNGGNETRPINAYVNYIIKF